MPTLIKIFWIKAIVVFTQIEEENIIEQVEWFVVGDDNSQIWYRYISLSVDQIVSTSSPSMFMIYQSFFNAFQQRISQ
jgi:2-keto-3-deoxy-galactonokinase